jgi:hypothetical protein
LRDDFSDGLNHLMGKPESVLDRPAVAVSALIGVGRQEVADQIAVRTVNFDPAESGFDRPPGCFDKSLDDVIEF